MTKWHVVVQKDDIVTSFDIDADEYTYQNTESNGIVVGFSVENQDGRWRNVGLYSNVISVEKVSDV